MKKTAGQISMELAAKKPDPVDPIELQREMQKEYMSEVIFTVKCALRKINCYSDAREQDKKWHKDCHQREAMDRDFYIEVQTRQDPLMKNIFRNQYLFRPTCPTPTWDQGVYKYHIKEEDLKFLWQVPDRNTCNMLHSIQHHIAEEEADLLRTVLMFKDGSLEAYAKRLNGEQEDSPFLKKE